jgi:hypothetical protein
MLELSNLPISLPRGRRLASPLSIRKSPNTVPLHEKYKYNGINKSLYLALCQL